jgi:hypothetical protein
MLALTIKPTIVVGRCAMYFDVHFPKADRDGSYGCDDEELYGSLPFLSSETLQEPNATMLQLFLSLWAILATLLSPFPAVDRGD